MNPRWRVEEGRLVEDEQQGMADVILTVPWDRVEAVIEAIAEPVRRALEEPEP